MVIFPLTLSLIFCGLLLAIAVLLVVMAGRAGSGVQRAPDDLPVDTSRYGPLLTNRWLGRIRALFAVLCVAALAMHGYWALGAPGGIAFDKVEVRDQRNRREAAAGLRGWVYDRTGRHERALISYRLDGRRIVRDYPLRDAATHVTGYSDFVYGSAGFEKGYGAHLTAPTSTWNRLVSPAPVGSDIVSTIDADLQREAYALLKGRRGAAVVVSLPDCEVLAMASSPSFDPAVVGDEKAWRELNEQAIRAPELSPMTDRALKTYYLPGSTFKVLVAVAAIESGLGDRTFSCRGDGFLAPRSRRPIEDDSGGAHGTIGLAEAVRVSCNQYFAQMGLEIGQARLAGVAQRFGIETGPTGDNRDRDLWRFRRADETDFIAAFAPPPARLSLPGGFDDDFTPYSLAIESFGQGPNQMTILQLALIAAGIGSGGTLTRPTLEAGVEPMPVGRVCATETALAVQAMMRDVVERGTAAVAFRGLGVSAGGKTGTAQREVTVYDPKTLEPETWRDREGVEHVRRRTAVDALFIGFAPFENPQIAFAVIVEDGGHGGRAAAPVAAGLVRKAVQLRLAVPGPATRVAGTAPGEARR